MNLRDIWYSINKTGELNILQFKIFCSIVHLDLDEDDYERVVDVFGKTINYENFKLFLKYG